MTFLPLLAASAGALSVSANLAFNLDIRNSLTLQCYTFSLETLDLWVGQSGNRHMVQVGTEKIPLIIVLKFDETPSRLMVRKHDNAGVFDRAFRISWRVGRPNKLSHFHPAIR